MHSWLQFVVANRHHTCEGSKLLPAHLYCGNCEIMVLLVCSCIVIAFYQLLSVVLALLHPGLFQDIADPFLLKWKGSSFFDSQCISRVLTELVLKWTRQLGPAWPRHVKNCPSYHCSWLWMINFLFIVLQNLFFSNDHIWHSQPVATSLRALKGQTLAPFNVGWRLPFCIFGSK